jgi:hypothetical protein
MICSPDVGALSAHTWGVGGWAFYLSAMPMGCDLSPLTSPRATSRVLAASRVFYGFCRRGGGRQFRPPCEARRGGAVSATDGAQGRSEAQDWHGKGRAAPEGKPARGWQSHQRARVARWRAVYTRPPTRALRAQGHRPAPCEHKRSAGGR